MYGKTKKFDRSLYKSRYSRKRESCDAFRELICRARVRHIFLSYNNEGIIPDETILETLKSRGPVEVFEADYAIFGNGAGRAVRRPIRERIFYCRVE